MNNKNINTKIINEEFLKELHTSLENEIIELQEKLKKLDENILNDVKSIEEYKDILTDSMGNINYPIIDDIEPDWEWLSDIKNGR